MKIRTKALAVSFLAAGFGLFVCSGCTRSEPVTDSTVSQNENAVAEDEGVVENPLEALFMQAQGLFDGGATNDAIASLENGLKDSKLAADRQQVFNMLIRMLTYAGKIEDARARMLDVYQNDAELASGAVGLLFQYYIDMAGDSEAALEWTETVLALENLPPLVRRNMREWNFVTLIQLGKMEKVVALAGKFVRDAPAGDAAVILQRGIDMLFDGRQFETVEKILATADGIISSDTSTRNIITSARLRLYAEQGKWSLLEKAFPTSAEALPDADLQRTFRRVLTSAAKAHQDQLTDSLSFLVITNFSDKAKSAAVAARQWADNAAKRNPAELPDRIELLLNRNFPPSLVCGIFLRYFYDVIDDTAIVGEMKEIGERLSNLAQDDDSRSAIRTMVLDSCFLLEDYDTALKILKGGIAGYDKTWHDMAIAKVSAHKALKENRPEEAISAFRSFMAIVSASKENEAADPSTGVIHTKEMILGRNAKRIGDIYRDMVKDSAKAKSAYDEARKYYQTTLDAKPEQEVIDVIKAEMSEIPQ